MPHRLSPDGPWFNAGVIQVSRFSRMKFLGVHGVYDYAGSPPGSRYRPTRVLPSPSVHKVSTPNWLFEAQYPAHQCPCLRFAPHLTVNPRKTRGQGGSLLLSCETLSFSTSCRFIPAHRTGAVPRSIPAGHASPGRIWASAVCVELVQARDQHNMHTNRGRASGLLLLWPWPCAPHRKVWFLHNFVGPARIFWLRSGNNMRNQPKGPGDA